MKKTIVIFAVIALRGCTDPELVKKKKLEQAELKKEQAILEEVLALQNKPDMLKFGCECGKALRSVGGTRFEITCNYTFDLNASKPFPGLRVIHTIFLSDGSTKVITNVGFIHNPRLRRESLNFSQVTHDGAELRRQVIDRQTLKLDYVREAGLKGQSKLGH